MRKYAEVGFQRLVVALPSKLSAEELEDYTALVTKLCDKCQVSKIRRQRFLGIVDGVFSQFCFASSFLNICGASFVYDTVGA